MQKGALRAGFIGLGFMGGNMARWLVRRGFPLSVFNRTASKTRDCVEAGAVACDTVAEVAARADVVCACLANVAASRELFLGESGLASTAREGQVFIDHGTVDHETSVDCYRAFRERGASFLDAPISGGPTGAREATLAILVGGDAAAFERARPVLSAMGKTIVRLGDAGAGTVGKLANQLLVGVHTLASCEALLLAQRAGVDIGTLAALLGEAWGQSRMLERNAPVIERGGFDESGSPLRNLLKDLDIVTRLSTSLGVRIPGALAATEVYRELSRRGEDEADITAAFRLLEGFRDGKGARDAE